MLVTNGKMGETDGGVMGRRPPLAPANRGGSTDVAGKGKRTLMARVAESQLTRAFVPVLLFILGVMVGMVGVLLSRHEQYANTRFDQQDRRIEYNTNLGLNTASRVTAIENRYGPAIDENNRRWAAVEAELRALRERQ